MDMLHAENAALVELKPVGFLTNREPCILRQNQFDHTSINWGRQGNLSDILALFFKDISKHFA
jgi:hypothetical protein